ncbi:MAG TPA: EAL domain-containing protein [Acidimicrobiia bacterium]|nr:EAL domain-containing protein [Acidimicrobiia bacterium]
MAIIAALLGFSWGLARLVGGAGAVAPLWFFIPIVLAAVRFGPPGAFIAGAASVVLAGPLLPATTHPMTAQPLSDWGTRGGFFILIGVFFALASRQPEGARALARRVTRLDRDLRHAMARGELEVHYQGIFDIGGRRRRVIGAEALLRWRHPIHGYIPPGRFVPIAEHTGLIDELGELVLAEVCQRVAAWCQLTDGPFVATVNLSARQLGDPDLARRVQCCLDTAGIDPSQLCFEITETSAMADIKLTQQQLQGLHDLGVRLAIDDFGTGYSSLAYVHLLPIDTIKIDRSFIERITQETNAAALVANVIMLAHTLGHEALAEGVETSEQLALLKSMLCDQAQGFHLHRPGPPDEITTALKRQRRQRRQRPRAQTASSQRTA